MSLGCQLYKEVKEEKKRWNLCVWLHLNSGTCLKLLNYIKTTCTESHHYMVGSWDTRNNPSLLHAGLFWGEQGFEFWFKHILPHSDELMIRITFHNYVDSP